MVFVEHEVFEVMFVNMATPTDLNPETPCITQATLPGREGSTHFPSKMTGQEKPGVRGLHEKKKSARSWLVECAHARNRTMV